MALVIGLTEMAAFLALAFAANRLADPPKRVRWILDDQSTRIRRFLNSDRRETLDPVLGWRPRQEPGTTVNGISAQGLRSLRHYDPAAADGMLRVAAFGDSFVYGSEVATEDSWPAQLETEQSSFEVLNYGVPGYGTDQAQLRFELEGSDLNPDYALLGFVSDDLRRLVNVYRRFISIRERPLTKPRFLLTGDSLVLLPPPLRGVAAYQHLLDHPRAVVTLGKHDQWYRAEIYENPLYDWSATIRLVITLWLRIDERFIDRDRLLDGDMFNPGAAAFRLQVALFERFAAKARTAGVQPLVLLFPDRGSLQQIARGRPPIYQPLMDELRRRGVDYVDLATAFPSHYEAAALDEWFAPKGHYAPAANRMIASTVGAEIYAREASSRRRAGAAEGAAP